MFTSLLGNPVTDVMTEVATYADVVSTFIIALCGLCVILFAIYVGVRFARATDDGKRNEAKQQLVYSIVAAIAMIMLVGLFVMVLKTPALTHTFGTDPVGVIMNETLRNVHAIVGTIISICQTLAVVLAVWIGWQLMKAEDEGKRKNAKMQLFYAVIGVVAVVLLEIIVTAAFDAM